MKILKFVISTLTLAISIALSYVIYKLTQDTTTGLANLSLILKLPVLIILGIILTGLLTSTAIGFIICIGSASRLIQVLSVIFLIITIALIGIDIIYFVGIVKKFKK